MSKEVKHIINLVLAAVGLAMGVAVIVLTTIDIKGDVAPKDMISLLAIAVISLGILALNNISKAK